MVKIRQDGYLDNPSDWSEEIAVQLAEYEKITLTEKHWEIIFYIRKYYLDLKSIPPVYKICAYTGLRTIDLYKLFPGGPLKSACRIAGLPPVTEFDFEIN